MRPASEPPEGAVDSATEADAALSQVAALAELGVMTASLVHEMRSSLFAAKGLVELASGRGSGMSSEALVQVLEHLRDLDDLLASYAGFGRLEGEVVRFEVRESLERALALADPRRRLVGAVVDWAHADREAWVSARPAAIRQVLLNVLHNAFDAVEHAPERRVRIATEQLDGRVLLIVEDTGPGVADSVRERLFSPFVSSKGPSRGTGLGLYISRRLAEEAGGSLELRDGVGGGTRVTLELPAA